MWWKIFRGIASWLKKSLVWILFFFQIPRLALNDLIHQIGNIYKALKKGFSGMKIETQSLLPLIHVMWIS